MKLCPYCYCSEIDKKQRLNKYKCKLVDKHFTKDGKDHVDFAWTPCDEKTKIDCTIYKKENREKKLKAIEKL